MHIKFTKHGGGSCKKAAAYLLQDKDHSGEVRSAVEVLRGDPVQTASVADSLDFDLKYRSAVISWAPTDQPTPEQIKNVLDDFEKMSLGGLDPARVSMSAVRHDEAGGGVHVHVLVARVDLATGKSFNPSPPGWQKSFDPIRDYHNARNNWARPDDPALARAVSAGRHDLPADVKKAKAIIDADIQSGIAAGVIENREDVLAAAADWGEITRQGEHYISVKPEGFEKAIRLKGGIYESEFSVSDGTEITREGEREAGNGTEDRRRRADEAKQSFADALKKRVEYNTHRYQIRDRADSRADRSGLEQDPNTNTAADPGLDPAHDHRPGAGPRSDGGDMGLELSSDDEYQQQTEDTDSDQRRDRQPTPSARTDPGRDPGNRHKTGRGAQLYSAATGSGTGVQSQQSASNQDNEIRYYMNNSNTEIERFKSDISLTEYAASCGYDVDPRKTSAHSICMKKGDSIIGISEGPRGHELYNDFEKGKGHGGTVIDFCQKVEGVGSLGQVRQKLREYTNSPRPPAAVAVPRPKPRPSPEARAAAVEREKRQLKPVAKPAADYLKSRGISNMLDDPRFDNIRQDAHGALAFPHYNKDGVSGCEKRGPEYKGFTPGGEKGLYCTRMPAECDKIIIGESGIDMLSHAECKPDPHAAYISVAGQMSQEQEAVLKDVISRHSDKTFVAAFDNDAAGQRFAEDLQRICNAAGAECKIDLPPEPGADWNKQLQTEIEQTQVSIESVKELNQIFKDEINGVHREPEPEPEQPDKNLSELRDELEQLKHETNQLEQLSAEIQEQREQQQYQHRGPSLSM